MYLFGVFGACSGIKNQRRILRDDSRILTPLSQTKDHLNFH